MLYETLALAYEEIESTSGTLEKTRLFSELLEEADPSEIGNIIALTIAKLHPDWAGEPEIGIAEKIAVQVVAAAASVRESVVKEKLREVGDIGAAAEYLLEEGAQTSLFAEDLTVQLVYNTLDAMSRITGKGSAKDKTAKLVGLLSDSSPLEAKYILRTITGQLRLGLGYMGVMDSLAMAFAGGKDARGIIENAFNVCSDLTAVAKSLATKGIDAVREVKSTVGRPIRMMAAKKLSDSAEIIEKAGPEVLVEYKYDGERVQVHKNGEEVTLFSRRQEMITEQYPDVVELVRSQVKATTCVLEGECVAIDPNTGRSRPFQELMRRRRKTDIEEMREAVPVAVYFFDILYHEGKDVTSLPLNKRRELLDKTVEKSDRVSLTVGEFTSDPERLDEIFTTAIDTGYEGVIAKAVHETSTYQAGSRSWLWIKLKASYQDGMSDSVDLVIVGAFFGRGKRTGLYGAILASVYDEDTDAFPTVCKIGTGFTDAMLSEFKERLEKHKLEAKNPKVVSDLEAEVWFDPEEVIEVLGDEITISPIHPAGKRQIKEGGLAIRFPRFTGRWRDDKGARQATSVHELVELFDRQRSRGKGI
ncbi:MAG: ATP-dependent DNA ligase [Candidatus Thorarchaeota archaeon]|jgi:DNA ligase-1